MKTRHDRGIEEGNSAVFVLNLISANMLRDSADLTARDVGMTNSVQQGGLAMVYMPQNRHDRRSKFEVFGVFLQNHAPPERNLALFFNNLFVLLKLGLKTEFRRDDRRSIEIDLLVDARHHAVGHQYLDDCNGAGAQQSSQFSYRQTIRKLNRLFFSFAHIYSSLLNGHSLKTPPDAIHEQNKVL